VFFGSAASDGERCRNRVGERAFEALGSMLRFDRVVAANQQREQPIEGAESRFVLYGVPWWTYVALRDALDDHAGLKMTYLHGTLELMSPSTLHEDAKTIIARLIEVWAMERDVDLRGFGGATFRKEAKERGLEPDECYKLGKLDDDAVPDIAIEVTVTSGLVDKMAVYAGLGVPEVWEWRPSTGTIAVHRLVRDAYERRERSEVLPDLDITQLSTFVCPGENQTQLAKAYQAVLRAR
jgi:Uma2 family endonuclease